MRALAWVVMVLISSSCSCGGCRPAAPTPVPDAGAAARVERDAGAPSVAVAAADDALLDGGLPWEASQNPPSPEALVAAYLADCHARVEVEFDDMDGPRKSVDCEALAFDQNCSPDVFGCWTGVEACKAGCAAPCNDCQAACADTCDGCKTGCDGGACATACAQSRVACRTRCLFALQDCRATTCSGAYEKCEADANARRERLCPDCAAITTCLGERHWDGGAAVDCLTEGNIAECLEWCSPDL